MDQRHASAVSILFTHFGEDWIRGSERVLIDLASGLDSARFRPVVWCNGATLAAELRGRGIRVHRSDFVSFFNYQSPPFSASRYLCFLAEGKRLAAQHGVRLLHANGAAPHQWLLPVAKLMNLPLVAHLHAPYLRRERFASLLHQASAIVGVSHRVAADFIADGYPAVRARVIPNGIDFSQFDRLAGRGLRDELGLSGEAVLIASVGSLIARKGFDILIAALARCDRPQAHIAIAGDGPERPRLESQVAALGLTDRVHFLGYRADISPLYAGADIAALASRSEAFGLALAEAGYFGLPVVASDVDGIPEVVTHGQTGLLVPPADPVALARALQVLIDDAELRRKLGAAARTRTSERFALSRMVTAFEDLYDALLTRSLTSRRGIDPRPYFRLLAGRSRAATIGTAVGAADAEAASGQ